MVAGQIDLNTGGVAGRVRHLHLHASAGERTETRATLLRKLIPSNDRACRRCGCTSRRYQKKMRKKSKRTLGVEEARPFAGMSRVNKDAAGVDIGAVEIVACVSQDESTQIVRAFGNYTVDLQNIGKWLKEHKIKTVAMESTGVYWIPLFEELERQGFECLLISSRSLRRVPGRKSDIID